MVGGELIEAGYRVLAFDARGHGESTWDGRPFSVEDLALDVAVVFEALELSMADVVGMSMGGCTALQLAFTRPDLVRRLVLADTTASYGPNRVENWEERAVQAERSPRESLLDFQLERWFSDGFRESNPVACDHAAEIFVGTPAAVHASACRALGGFDVTRVLPRISADTLILVGEEDYATPPVMAQDLAAGLPNARLQILPNTRHFSLIESHQAWQLVREHLAAEPSADN